MFCSSCGEQIDDINAAFCPNCGAGLRQPAPASQPSPAPPVRTAPVITQTKASHTGRNIAIIAVVIVLVLIIGVYISGLFTGTGIGSSTHTVNIVNGLVTVNAGSYEDYQFTVPSGASSASVSGSFTASGGSGNDIRVYIMDSTDFVNWQNGHTASTYYDSGQVTTGTISASLSPGTYYLVYDNTFSVISQKNVNTQVNLQYTS